MLSIYLIAQYISAIIHRLETNKITTGDYSQKVSILVVGYKENEKYFKACIQSINKLTYPNIELVVFVSDDNTHESKYMHDIVKNTLKKHNTRSLAISHAGKRHAMNRGFQEILLDQSNFILTIDSDTILKSDCIERFIDTITHNPKLGAVTGHIKIFNDSSIISFVSRLRYFFAFNIERSAQSLYGVVNCISGPLGLYKKEIIQDSREAWLTQTFMNQECSYGDDRHLTYHVLKRGYNVGYTHLAEAETESPETISRWFTQQTRWNKSSIRETKWTLKTINKHNFWMTLELVYMLCYHLIVLGSLLYIILFTNAFYIATWFLVTFSLTFLKGIIASIIDSNPIYLLFPIYNLLFTFFFIPSKIYALFTLRDTQWGTSTRKNITHTGPLQIYPAFIWMSLLLAGIIYNFVILTTWNTTYIILCSTVPFIYILFIGFAKIHCLYFYKGIDKVYTQYDLH